MKLYDFWRSSAAYRVRIALNLKGLNADQIAINLAPGHLEQASPEYQRINPQGLVPTFVLDNGQQIFQSLAILEYLDELYPDPPLLPSDPLRKADIRALAQMVACDIHPLNNARVLAFLKGPLGHDAETVSKVWYAHWIKLGFEALEGLIGETGFCRGNRPTLADCCLIPQIYNARRFDVNLDAFPKIRAVADTCNEIQAFADAAPERQPDAIQA